MDKQEAIETIKNIDTLNINDMIAGQQVDMVIKNQVLDLISQIHEPQKVVVPQVAVDYYERYKDQLTGFDEWFGDFYEDGFLAEFPQGEKLAEWLYDNDNDTNCQRELALATLIVNGPGAVEVEREKLYEVIIPHTNNYKNQKQYLVKQGKNWFFCGNDVNRFKYQFTKGQIEAAGFGWVFDCDGAKVVEVE